MSPAHHPRGGPLIVALSAALAAYCAGYLAGAPAVVYLPVSGAWVWEAPPSAIAMAYYGHVANGALAWLFGWTLAHIPPIRRRLEDPRAVASVSWLCIALLVLALLVPVVAEVRAVL